MKVVAKISFVMAVMAMMVGCASDTAYIPKIPNQAQAKLLDYNTLPGNKVFVIAVDPSGDYAFGYEAGQPTLKDAAKIAVEKCDANREANGVLAKPYIYAINNKVVYEEMIRKANADKKNASQAQIDEAGRQGAVKTTSK